MMDRLDELGYAAYDTFHMQMFQHFQVALPHAGKTYWNSHFYNTFRKIGDLCQKNGINVIDYIVVNFQTLERSNHRYITPKDFANKNAVDRYQVNNSNLGAQAFSSWVVQAGMLADFEGRLIPEFYESEEEILKSLRLPFTPWFRVLYPEPFSEVIYRIFGAHAHEELGKDKRLREFARERANENLEELERRIGHLDDRIIKGAIGL